MVWKTGWQMMSTQWHTQVDALSLTHDVQTVTLAEVTTCRWHMSHDALSLTHDVQTVTLTILSAFMWLPWPNPDHWLEFSGGFPTGQKINPRKLWTCARNSHANLARLGIVNAWVWVHHCNVVPMISQCNTLTKIGAKRPQTFPINQTSAKAGLPKICLPGPPPPQFRNLSSRTPPPNLEICLPGTPKFGTPKGPRRQIFGSSGFVF